MSPIIFLNHNKLLIWNIKKDQHFLKFEILINYANFIKITNVILTFLVHIVAIKQTEK